MRTLSEHHHHQLGAITSVSALILKKHLPAKFKMKRKIVKEPNITFHFTEMLYVASNYKNVKSHFQECRVLRASHLAGSSGSILFSFLLIRFLDLSVPTLLIVVALEKRKKSRTYCMSRAQRERGKGKQDVNDRIPMHCAERRRRKVVLFCRVCAVY